MPIEYDEEEDILIKRAYNGWVVVTPHPTSEGTLVSVYEEDDTDPNTNSESEAVYRMICDLFESYLQTKYKGGLQVSVEKKGWSFDTDTDTDDKETC